MSDSNRSSNGGDGGFGPVGNRICTTPRLLLAILCMIIAMFVVVLVWMGDQKTQQQQLQQQLQQPLQPQQQQEKQTGVLSSVGDNLNDTKEDEFEVCDDTKYTKKTLRLAYELPFQALFTPSHLKQQDTFEASSVVAIAGDGTKPGTFFVVHDSSWAITKLEGLEHFHPANLQLGDPGRVPNVDSDYEALVHDAGKLYAIRESVLHDNGEWHSIVEELELIDNMTDYTVVESCSTEFQFEGDWKGFEGALAVRSLDNELIILGLCEGNHCSEQPGRYDDVGNGKLVAMRKEMVNGTCQWSTIRQIDIPPTVTFTDYSAIALREEGHVGISSQEMSQFWKGQLVGLDATTGLWDIDFMEFNLEEDKIYDFPKDHNCNTQYCNIEGVSWINHKVFVAVSDKMKSKGRQDFRCFDKDESIHLFVLP